MRQPLKNRIPTISILWAWCNPGLRVVIKCETYFHTFCLLYDFIHYFLKILKTLSGNWLFWYLFWIWQVNIIHFLKSSTGIEQWKYIQYGVRWIGVLSFSKKSLNCIQTVTNINVNFDWSINKALEQDFDQTAFNLEHTPFLCLQFNVLFNIIIFEFHIFLIYNCLSVFHKIYI